MTGFASIEGAGHGWRWSWELRSVNARGLDIRLRLPDWPGGLDAPVPKDKLIFRDAPSLQVTTSKCPS